MVPCSLPKRGKGHLYAFDLSRGFRISRKKYPARAASQKRGKFQIRGNNFGGHQKKKHDGGKRKPRRKNSGTRKKSQGVAWGNVNRCIRQRGKLT